MSGIVNRVMFKLRRDLAAWSAALALLIAFEAVLAQNEGSEEKLRLVVGSSNNFPPINFLDEDGELNGFARNLSQAVAEEVGVAVDYLHSDDWLEVMRYLEEGQIDFIHDTGYTRERDSFLDYTDTILEMPESIFVREKNFDIQDIESLSGKAVACVNEHITHLYLKNFPQIDCYLVNTPSEGIVALINGDVEAFIYPEQIVHYLSHRLNQAREIKVVGEPVRVLRWSMTVKEGDQELLDRLNQGIRAVKASGEYQKIYDRWFGRPMLSGYARDEVVALIVGSVILTLLIAALIGVLFYVRAIRRASRELAKSESTYRTLSDNLPYSVFFKDANSVYISCNQHHANSLGVSVDEIAGKTDFDFHSEEDAIEYRAGDRKVVESREVSEFTERYVERGRERLIHTIKTPTFSEDGRVAGILGIIRDITDEERAKAALLKKEEEQREILDSMVEAVVMIDKRGSIAGVNKTAERLFGCSERDMQGKHWTLLAPESEAKELDSDLAQYLETGESQLLGIGKETMGLGGDGEAFPMRMTLVELPKGVKGIRRLVVSCQDLTKIKQQEEQLRRAQKMDAIGKITGGIAHDYNNMLGIIVGNAALLESDLENHPEFLEEVKEIRRAGERGAKLARKLLDISKKTSSEEKQVDVNKLLLGEEHILEKTLTARIKLHLDLEKELWPVWLDEGDLEDAVLNMSINAMHAISGSGSLTIQTRNQKLDSLEAQTLGLSKGDYVLLIISDTGCGMDEKTRDRVFEPFYSTKGDEGTGLGLSQVYSFVERSSGAIKVYSELNVGTRLMLYFPRYLLKGKDENGGEVVVDSGQLNGEESILVVDDEPGLLNLASKMLSRRGYEVLLASSGSEALKLLESRSVDLLFSDVIMSGMNGYQLAEQVRKLYPGIKILMTSGFTGDLHQSYDEGLYDGMIQKPYSSILVLKKVRSLLDAS